MPARSGRMKTVWSHAHRVQKILELGACKQDLGLAQAKPRGCLLIIR